MGVLFHAKIAADNSDLNELDGYKPFSSPVSLTTSIKSKYEKYPSLEDGRLTVKVTQDGAIKYQLRIWTSPKDGNQLFTGDFEPRLFKGSDLIKGSKQADVLYGYKGPDSIYSGDVVGNIVGDDTIFGGKGADWLYGSGGDTIFGGAGNDLLNTGAGMDALTGGGGKDVFSFSAALIAGNYAQIKDFTPGDDKIKLNTNTFEGIGLKGELPAGQFFLASDYGGQAKSVIYDDATGNLSYAQNGGDAQVFGRIANGAALSHEDFLIA